MRFILVFTLAAAAALARCAGSPARALMGDASALDQYPNETLCHAWSMTRSEKMSAELHAREALTDSEWAAARDRHVFIGMSELAALCSWGMPDRVNRTTTADGLHMQWVFHRGSSPNAYLYVDAGHVTAIQN